MHRVWKLMIYLLPWYAMSAMTNTYRNLNLSSIVTILQRPYSSSSASYVDIAYCVYLVLSAVYCVLYCVLPYWCVWCVPYCVLCTVCCVLCAVCTIIVNRAVPHVLCTVCCVTACVALYRVLCTVGTVYCALRCTYIRLIGTFINTAR
jgi:succinate-acetate transporter protein